MRTFLLLICFFVGACATSAERAPARFNVDDAFVVEFESNWTDISGPSRMPHRSVHLLTIQAPSLQRLYLVGDLPPGESMAAAPSRRQDAVVYRADLSRTELVEFVSANLSALGFVRIEPRNIRSAVLGGANGVRFDARMQTTAGLDYSVMALAAQSEGGLRLILFAAPDEHYFPRLSPEIDRMLNRAASS